MHSVCGSKCIHHQRFPRASLFGELYVSASSLMQQAVSLTPDANTSLSSRALKKGFCSLGHLSCRQLTSHPSPCRPLLLPGRGGDPPPFHGPQLSSLRLPHSLSQSSHGASRSPKRLLLKARTPSARKGDQVSKALLPRNQYGHGGWAPREILSTSTFAVSAINPTAQFLPPYQGSSENDLGALLSGN